MIMPPPPPDKPTLDYQPPPTRNSGLRIFGYVGLTMGALALGPIAVLPSVFILIAGSSVKLFFIANFILVAIVTVSLIAAFKRKKNILATFLSVWLFSLCCCLLLAGLCAG